MDIVERLRQQRDEDDWEVWEKLAEKAAAEIERFRSRLENPTEEMLKAGRAANRLVAGNALGLACIAPDTMWKAMADIALKEGE